MDASRFFVINLFSGTAQESRTKLSVLDPVRSFHPIQFCFGVQFAKPLHGLYSSGQASVVPLLECCVAHLAMLHTFEIHNTSKESYPGTRKSLTLSANKMKKCVSLVRLVWQNKGY